MGKLDSFLADIDKAEAADSGQRAAHERFTEAARQEADATEARIKQADLGKGDFTVYELRYAARDRCSCGAGMAYPDGIGVGVHGAWHCSAILLGQAKPGSTHSPSLPFSFYSVKSEGQPSADGASTRPPGTHVETKPTYACMNCGNSGDGPQYRLERREALDAIACSKCGEKYINSDGSSNMKLKTRYSHVVVDDIEMKEAT